MLAETHVFFFLALYIFIILIILPFGHGLTNDLHCVVFILHIFSHLTTYYLFIIHILISATCLFLMILTF